MGSGQSKSVLDVAFGEPVHIRDVYVGRMMVRGFKCAGITVNLRNVVAASGFPVFWNRTKRR
jgi:hypothetical protein